MKRVVIVGGGVSGLVCSHVFRKRGVHCVVVEPKGLGGEFLAGGLKYIHQTALMEQLFTDLDVAFSNYTIQGGILLRGDVHLYPKCLQDMPPDEAARIQADHWRKTRRAEPGDDGKKAMNDPASTKPRKALRCDFVEMVAALSRGVNWVKAGVERIDRDAVVASTGESLPFDYCVVTIPLWLLRGLTKWYVPEGVAMKLNVATVVPQRDRYQRWDYVYTPYTPADAIHRFSPSGAGYAVEINGQLDQVKLLSDLNFIFGDAWTIEGLKEGLKGHLLPLETEPDWPKNVAPLGRFAKWDSRATTDVTLEDAIALAERWFG